MKLRAIRVRQFRRFTRPVAVEGIADGVNLLAGANETGKSTLFFALESAFLTRFKVTGSGLDAMRPHGGGEPLVEVDFEADGVLWRVRKQFGRGASAALIDVAGGRTIARNADAEDAAARLTSRAGEAPGRFGLVWVRQQHALRGPDLDVDPETGKARDRGERAALLDAIGEEIGEAAAGPAFELVRAKARAALEVLVTAGRATPKKNGPLDLALRDREVVSRELGEALRAAETSEARLSRIAAMAQERAALAAPDVIAAQTAAADDLKQRLMHARERRQRLDPVREVLQAREAELQAAEQALSAHGSIAEALAEKRRARDLGQSLATEIERLSAAINLEPVTPAALDGLVAGEHECRIRAAELAAVSVVVDAALTPDGAGKVRVSGKRIGPRERVETPGAVAIEIDGIGTLTVAAGQAARAGALAERSEAAGRALAEAFARLSVGSLAEARERAAKRAEMVESVERARAKLAALAPEGLPRLRADVAAHEERLAAAEAVRPSPQTLARLRAAAGDARQALESAASEALSDQAFAELSAAADRAANGVARRASDLARLDMEIAKAKSEQAGADEGGRAGAVAGLQEVLARANDEVRRLEHEVAALQLLARTLDAIEAEARSEMFAPIARRLIPHLERLFGPSGITFGEDFALLRLQRAAGEEPFDTLSDGTREQVSVLVRLAYAELLADRGLPAPIVLDDPFVYSDEERLATLNRLLANLSGVPQIVVLTCRPSAFSDLPGTRLTVTPWSDPG